MKNFTVYYSSKANHIIANIIVNEDLDVRLTIEQSTLGDTVICVYGAKEEIEILEQIYNMVA